MLLPTAVVSENPSGQASTCSAQPNGCCEDRTGWFDTVARARALQLWPASRRKLLRAEHEQRHRSPARRPEPAQIENAITHPATRVAPLCLRNLSEIAEPHVKMQMPGPTK